DRAEDLGARPTEIVAVDDAVHDDEQAGAGERQADDVEPALRTVCLLEAEVGEGHGDDADGYVEPEDPVPVETLRDRATDHRADCDRETTDATPGAEREWWPLSGDAGRKDGEREGRDGGAPD